MVVDRTDGNRWNCFFVYFWVFTRNQTLDKGVKFFLIRTENPSVGSSILPWPTMKIKRLQIYVCNLFFVCVRIHVRLFKILKDLHRLSFSFTDWVKVYFRCCSVLMTQDSLDRPNVYISSIESGSSKMADWMIPKIFNICFNFTKAAEEKNAENLLIIRNKKLAETYIDNWYKL